MIIKEIKYGSIDYKNEVELRDKVLRKPLGLKFTKEQLDEEKEQFHFCAFDNEKIIGCLLLKPQSNAVIQMRQVAVDDVEQGKGIGRQLVLFAEKFALEKKFKEIILHARDTAIPFYENLGYEKIGGGFVEVTIPHWEMKKSLSKKIIISKRIKWKK